MKVFMSTDVSASRVSWLRRPTASTEAIGCPGAARHLPRSRIRAPSSARAQGSGRVRPARPREAPAVESTTGAQLQASTRGGLESTTSEFTALAVRRQGGNRHESVQSLCRRRCLRHLPDLFGRLGRCRARALAAPDQPAQRDRERPVFDPAAGGPRPHYSPRSLYAAAGRQRPGGTAQRHGQPARAARATRTAGASARRRRARRSIPTCAPRRSVAPGPSIWAATAPRPFARAWTRPRA